MYFNKLAAAALLVASLLALQAPVAQARTYGSLLCEGQAHQTYTGGSATDILIACTTNGQGSTYCSNDWIGSAYSFGEWARFRSLYSVTVTCERPAQAALCLYQCDAVGNCNTRVVKTCPQGEEAVVTALADSNARRLRAEYSSILEFPADRSGALAQAGGADDDARRLQPASQCVEQVGCCAITAEGIMLFNMRCGPECTNACA